MSEDEVKARIEKMKADKIEKVKELQQKKKDLGQKTLDYVKKQQELLENLITVSKKEGLSKEEREGILQKIEVLTKTLKDTLSNTQKTIGKKVLPKSPTTTKAPTKNWKNVRQEKVKKDQLDRELEQIQKAKEQSKKDAGLTSSQGTEESPEKKEQEEPKTTSNLESLQSKLVSLQEEAAQLGLSPSPRGRGYWRSGRSGRGRGRGRGWGRGRAGTFVSHVLDNRTSSFLIHDVPIESLDENKLREHFGKFGEVKTVTLYGNDAVISMDSRRNAEKAIKHGNSLDSKESVINWYTPKEYHNPARGSNTERESDQLEGDQQEEPIVEEFQPTGSGPILPQSDSDEEDDETERKR